MSSTNPYAAFAAGSTTNNNEWLTTRKTGRDDTAIRQAAEVANVARKNRRGGARAAAKKPSVKGSSKRRRRVDDESDEDSFIADDDDDEEEDDFIVHSEEEEESLQEESEEGDWDSDLEDDESVVGKNKKKMGGKGKKRVGVTKPKEEKAVKRGGRRGVRNKTGRQPVYDVDDSSEEETMNKSLEDDIYDSSPEMKLVKKVKKSPYFSNNDSDSDVEEKKEDDSVALKTGKPNNKKRILEDSDSDEDVGFGFSTFSRKSADNNDDFMDDTPVKSGFDADDFVDDDEAVALEAAMKASLKDQRKRLKKKKNKSSLEMLQSPKKKKQKKESKVIYLDDLEEEEPEAASGEDDGEISVASNNSDDEEQKTAAQVLNEANALSAKIVKIVGQWCGEQDVSSKGLILGDGALAFGGGGSNAQFTQMDNEWISKETMKMIMPTVELAEYQLLGVNWMALLNRLTFMKGKRSGKKGNKDGKMNVNGILADEMGLGKTVQTIAFLAWLNYQNGGGSKLDNVISIDDEENKPSNESINLEEATITLDSDNENDDRFMRGAANTTSARRPHLIVVPASVLSNWMNEFKKFAPHMVVVKYHGSQNERLEIQQDMRKYLPKDKDLQPNAHLDAVLTTFSYFSSEKGEDRSFLRKFHFDYLIVDEGHTLKNPKGLRYKNLNKFLTSHRLLLTGTPVQNSPKELMSLLCFLMPLFDSKTKSSKGFDSDDEKGGDGGERMLEHFVHLEAAEGGDAAAYRKLKQLFAPFVLRRKKSDVLSQIMPPKTRKVDLVDMDETTSSVYNAILSNAVKGNTDTKSGQFTKFKNMSAQKHLFTELRKAANHPLLLRTRHLEDNEIDDLARRLLNYNYFGSDATCTLQLVKNELKKMSDYDIHCAALTMIEENGARREYLDKYTLVENDMFCSPKFVRLRVLLPELVGKGHRILLFSQWTRVLDLLHNLLEMLGMRFLRLDGQTDVSDRQALIDRFTNDSAIPVFLLSTRAGGMGLNLTAADVCILHDLDFNPFNDLQAEDRCHRIGQKKPVTIIKMVTKGSVDEAIYSLQERKERMNEAIMDEKGNTKKSGDNDDIKEIMKAAVDDFIKSPPPTKIKSMALESEKVETIISIEE